MLQVAGQLRDELKGPASGEKRDTIDEETMSIDEYMEPMKAVPLQRCDALLGTKSSTRDRAVNMLAMMSYNIAQSMRTHHQDMIKDFSDDIDTLLTFVRD